MASESSLHVLQLSEQLGDHSYQRKFQDPALHQSKDQTSCLTLQVSKDFLSLHCGVTTDRFKI